MIDYPLGAPWNAEQDAFFKAILPQAEMAIPATPPWMLAYPFLATLAPQPRFDSVRAGFGPLARAMLPLALAGGWRARIARSDLLFYALVCFVAYACWFLFGSSQRLRHFLPTYPLLLVVMTVAVARAVDGRRLLAGAAVAVAALCLAIQLGGTALYAKKAVTWLAGDETREHYLARMVPGFASVEWMNGIVPLDGLVMVDERASLYFYDVPAFLAHLVFQAVVDVRPPIADAGRLWREMAALGVTYLLVSENGDIAANAERMVAAGCATFLRAFATTPMVSRIVPGPKGSVQMLDAYRLRPGACPGLGFARSDSDSNRQGPAL